MVLISGWKYNLFCLLSAAALLISGCSSGQENNSRPVSISPQITSSQQDIISLEIWVIEQHDTFLSQLVEAFEQQNAGIDVVITQIPEEQYSNRLPTALQNKEGPDLAQVVQSDWLALGIFQPLNSTVDDYRVPINDFNTGAITRACMFQGQVYCLGSLTSGTILIYNKDLFDLFGAAYPPSSEPLSMQEYHDLVIGLTQKSDKIEERIWGGDVILPIQWMDPETHISPDGRRFVGFLNDEPTSKAYQWLADIYLHGSTVTVEEAEILQQDSLELLIAGRQATALVDSAAAIPVLEQSGIRWGAAIVPTEQKGDAKWSSNWTDGLGLTRASQNSTAAAQFLVFMAHRGSQLRLERGEIPLNMPLAEQWAAASLERQQVFDALRQSRAYPFIPGFADTASHIWPAWEEMIEQEAPAKVALDEISGPMQKVLDQRWEEFEVIQPDPESPLTTTSYHR